MDRRKTYYSILGVEKNASLATIKRAYRQLAKRYHPDVTPGTSPEEFREVQDAYETLADAERRRRYDESLGDRDGWAPLSWSFVRPPNGGDLRRPVRPGSLSGEILLTDEEARAGGVLPLDVPIEAACPECDGTGGFLFDCPTCVGEGRVERRLPVPVRIPAGVREGTTFQVWVEEASVLSILLTVHIRPE